MLNITAYERERTHIALWRRHSQAFTHGQRNQHLQQPVLEARFDRFQLHSLGQDDSSAELAVQPLPDDHALLFDWHGVDVTLSGLQEGQTGVLFFFSFLLPLKIRSPSTSCRSMSAGLTPGSWASMNKPSSTTRISQLGCHNASSRMNIGACKGKNEHIVGIVCRFTLRDQWLNSQFG